MPKSEKVVQARIRGLLDARGIAHEKMWGNAINKDFPDLFCGKFWIEVKAPGKKLRQGQMEWCERFDAQGVKVYVVDDERQLWSVVGTPAGTAPNNWRAFCPKTDQRTKLATALNEWASPASPHTP